MSASRAVLTPAADTERLFRRRTARILTGVSALSLAVGLVLTVLSGEPEAVRSAGPDSFSPSAIGYRALVELIEASDVPVTIRRSAGPCSAGSLLLLLSPPAAQSGRMAEAIARALGEGATVVVVLPKWEGAPQDERPDWVARVGLLPLTDADEIATAALRAAEPGAEPLRVARLPRAFGWQAPALDPAALPDLPVPQVLLGAEGLEAIATVAGGAVVVAHPKRPLVIVSDPDLLNTAGLARGDNAVLVHRLLLGRTGATAAVVDERVHGYELQRSLGAELGRFPLLLVTLHLALLLALMLWATTSRFGAPEPPAPRVPPGSASLVRHMALLLESGGHLGETVRQYRRLTLRHAAREHALPAGAGDQAHYATLRALARHRGATVDIEGLSQRVLSLGDRRVAPRHALHLARELHRWRQELAGVPVGRSLRFSRGASILGGPQAGEGGAADGAPAGARAV